MKFLLALGAIVSLSTAWAQTSAGLAEQLQNPVSSLARAELQNRWDFRMGPLDQGSRYTLDCRPVLPISLGPNWNLISRTGLPFISQEDVFKEPPMNLPESPRLQPPAPIGSPIYKDEIYFAGGDLVLHRPVLVGFVSPEGYKQELRRQKEIRADYAKRIKRLTAVDHHQDGLGDITQSFLFSPKKLSPGGVAWGIGPSFSFPAATDDLLGSGKWCAGPEAVALKQAGGWTYGVRAAHLWSYAGDDDRRSVSATLVDPFVSYTWRSGTTFGVDMESAYDWSASQWSVPVGATVSQVVMLGRQPVSFSMGALYTATGPATTGEWGLSASVSLLFPARAATGNLK